MLTEAEVREKVRGAMEREGGVRALAKRLEVSPSYVSDVCCGRRAPGPAFLRLLGLRKVVGYDREAR